MIISKGNLQEHNYFRNLSSRTKSIPTPVYVQKSPLMKNCNYRSYFSITGNKLFLFRRTEGQLHDVGANTEKKNKNKAAGF